MNLPNAITHGRPALLRFVLTMVVGNLIWDLAHVPLYTLWLTGSWA
jgi:hypothetical protein